jgi:chlorophyll synthase
LTGEIVNHNPCWMSDLAILGATSTRAKKYPSPLAVLELLKPITWFPPMWAFMCGAVSSGAPAHRIWPMALVGMILAGPAICATSQAVNDWFDREVDAINEPQRPIPSGRIPGAWGLAIAIVWTLLSLTLAATLGRWVFYAGLLGMALAWAYSAPPFRLKQSGWWGPACVALCYEGLAWFTGAAVTLRALPDLRIITLAALYSFGAIGIMVLNDFKAIKGDVETGVRSLPAELGVENAVWLACILMAAPQLDVVALLLVWGQPVHAALVAAMLMAQVVAMGRLLRDPAKLAPWYNATGVSLYVLGMLVSGFALGAHLGGAR